MRVLAILLCAGCAARVGQVTPTGHIDFGDLVQVTGEIVVLDEDGVEHAAEDGTVTAWFLRESGGTVDDVEVVGGRFSVDAPRGLALRLDGATLGGRWAIVEETLVDPAVTQRVALRARWPRPMVLRVVDAANGRDLDGVDLSRWDESGEVHVAQGAASPIPLPPRAQLEGYEVRVPGYAWCEIRCDHPTGGTRIARLRPGGAVDVLLDNLRPADDVTIRIRPGGAEEDDVVRAVTPNADGTCAIEGLLPGTYDVAAEATDGWVARARASVVVEEGERAAVVLVLAERPPTATAAGPHARLRGTLHVPSGWDDESLTLYVQSVNEDQDAPHVDIDVPLGDISERERRTIRWDAGDVPPGTYDIRIEPIGYEHRFEVSAGTRRRDVRVAVPPPATVHIDCVDETGRPVAVRRDLWSLPRASCTTRAPVGQRFFPWVFDARYRATASFIIVGPGENRIRLVVHPVYRVRLVFQEQGAVVPWEPGWKITVEPVEHRGRVVPEGPHWLESAKMVSLDRPGRYRVRVESIPNYRAPPDREIIVRGTDDVQDVRYELTPE